MLPHEPRHRSLTIKVRTATCAGARAGRVEALASGAGECGLPLERGLDVSPSPRTSDRCQLTRYGSLDERIIIGLARAVRLVLAGASLLPLLFNKLFMSGGKAFFARAQAYDCLGMAT